MLSGTTGDLPQHAALDRLVDRQLRAEREVDVEAALCAMTDDVKHEVIGVQGGGTARGTDAVRARYLETFANTAAERTIPLRRLYGDGFVVAEMIWEGRVIGRLGPCRGGGRRVSHRVLHIFEVCGDRISSETVYIDMAAVMQQLP